MRCLKIDLNILRYFVRIAEEGGISRAADALFLSQPTLSQQMHRLEKELDVQLLQREARGASLTPAGQIFLRYARNVLQQTTNLRAELSSLREELAGTIRLASEVLSIPLARLYCDFRRQHPRVRADFVHLPQIPPPDLAITTNVLDHLAWTGRVLLRERLLVALRIDHPLAARKGLRLTDLRGEPMIFSQNREVDRLVSRYCATAGFAPNVAMECYSMHTVIALVAAGLGLAVLPEYWRAYKPDNVRLLPIEDAEFFRTIFLYHPRNTQRNYAAEAFEGYILAHLGDVLAESHSEP